jgi:hypothetical protein
MTLNDYDKKVLLSGWRQWRHLIQFIAPDCALEIGAIAFRESTWRPNQQRYERGFHERYIRGASENAKEWRRRLGATGYQEHKYATSWGLMQIMGVTAYERGYRGDPERLIEPELSLVYGAMHLDWLWQKYERIQDAIAAYNAGSPRHLDGTTYVNQAYVDYVLAGLAALRVA